MDNKTTMSVSTSRNEHVPMPPERLERAQATAAIRAAASYLAYRMSAYQCKTLAGHYEKTVEAQRQLDDAKAEMRTKVSEFFLGGI